MKKMSLALVAILVLVLSQPSQASNSVEIKTKGISWSVPSSINVPVSGCSEFSVSYTWGSTLAASEFAMARLSIDDNDGGMVAYHYQFRRDTPKSGQVKMKLCAEMRQEAGYDRPFVGAKPGPVFVTAFFYDMGNINRQNQLDEQETSIQLRASVPSSGASTDASRIVGKVASTKKNTWTATILNAKGKEVTVMVWGTSIRYFKSIARSNKHVVTQVLKNGSGKTVSFSIKVGSEWVLRAEGVKLR